MVGRLDAPRSHGQPIPSPRRFKPLPQRQGRFLMSPPSFPTFGEVFVSGGQRLSFPTCGSLPCHFKAQVRVLTLLLPFGLTLCLALVANCTTVQFTSSRTAISNTAAKTTRRVFVEMAFQEPPDQEEGAVPNYPKRSHRDKEHRIQECCYRILWHRRKTTDAFSSCHFYPPWVICSPLASSSTKLTISCRLRYSGRFPFLGRFGLGAGLVALRQRFVRRCH